MKSLLLTLAFATSLNVQACTTIIIGRAASADGSIMVARNVDPPNIRIYRGSFLYHPPTKDAYEIRGVQNQFVHQVPPNSIGYSGLADIRYSNYSYEESGFNDLGVGVSATETILSNKKTLLVDPYVKQTGIGEESINSAVLPQARSARHATQILGSLIENYGAAEGFGVGLVDAKEAWYLENAGGHHWVAVRIPDDAYFVSANQSRIGEVDLSDTANVLASPGIARFAKTNGLFHPERGEKFNFRNIFGGDTERDVGYNYPRVAHLQGLFTASLHGQKVNGNSFPTFLKPDRKLSVSDVEEALKTYYVDTSSDPYTTKNPGATARPISVYRTTQSHILQTRGALPPAIANVQYLNLGMTALGMYVPFYHGVAVPEEFSIRVPDEPDSTSAFWKFRKVQLLAMQDFPRYAPMVRAAFDALRRTIAARQEDVEKEYIATYSKEPLKAKSLLDNFVQKSAADALATAESLTNKIMLEMSADVEKKYRFPGNG